MIFVGVRAVTVHAKFTVHSMSDILANPKSGLLQGHYKGSSGGGSTKVDAESGEVAAVAAANNKPDPGDPHVMQASHRQTTVKF